MWFGVVVLSVILHVPAVAHGLALDAHLPHGHVMLLRGTFLGWHNLDWNLRRFGFRWFLDCDGHSSVAVISHLPGRLHLGKRPSVSDRLPEYHASFLQASFLQANPLFLHPDIQWGFLHSCMCGLD